MSNINTYVAILFFWIAPTEGTSRHKSYISENQTCLNPKLIYETPLLLLTSNQIRFVLHFYNFYASLSNPLSVKYAKKYFFRIFQNS